MNVQRLLRYIGGQGVAQVLTILSAILIVRALSLEDYARYSIAVSVIAAGSLLASGGVATALLSQGASAITAANRPLYEKVELASRQLARGWGSVAAAAAGFAVLSLLLLADAAIITSLMCALLVATGVVLTVDLVINRQRLRLMYNFRRLTRGATLVAAARSAAIMALFLLGLLDLVTALMLQVLGTLLERRFYRSDKKAEAVRPSTEHLRSVRATARRALPVDTFYVLQGQALNLLLPALGALTSLAAVAALSRFTVVYTIFHISLSGLVEPYFARRPAVRQQLLRSYLCLLGAYAGVLTGLTFVFWSCRSPLLGMLGPSYAGLDSEFIVLTSGAAASAFVGAMAGLNQARGWLRGLRWYIPVSTFWTIALLAQLPIERTEGAAVYSALTFVPMLIVQTGCLVRGLSRTGRR